MTETVVPAVPYAFVLPFGVPEARGAAIAAKNDVTRGGLLGLFLDHVGARRIQGDVEAGHLHLRRSFAIGSINIKRPAPRSPLVGQALDGEGEAGDARATTLGRITAQPKYPAAGT
jgi:hypothetical protein